MANVNTKLRKINKGFVNKIKEDSVMKPDVEVSEDGGNFLKPTGVQPLTLREQLFKGNKITMNFIGADEEKGNLKTLQLVIFLNGKLKYSSKKGVFGIKTISHSALKRKGWKLYCETEKRDRLVFNTDKGFKDFIGFCTQVRDCVEIQEMYHKLCYDFVEQFKEVLLEEETGKIYDRVDLG